MTTDAILDRLIYWLAADVILNGRESAVGQLADTLRALPVDFAFAPITKDALCSAGTKHDAIGGAIPRFGLVAGHGNKHLVSSLVSSARKGN